MIKRTYFFKAFAYNEKENEIAHYHGMFTSRSFFPKPQEVFFEADKASQDRLNEIGCGKQTVDQFYRVK